MKREQRYKSIIKIMKSVNNKLKTKRRRKEEKC